MNLRALALAALFAGSAGGFAYAADMPVKAVPPPKPVPFFFVNDTSVSATWYSTRPTRAFPAAATSFLVAFPGEKNTFYRAQGSVDHFDVWEYGTNLIHLELDQYGKRDPILGEPGAVGSREFFGFTRSTIGFNEITHSKAFDTFLTNDVGSRAASPPACRTTISPSKRPIPGWRQYRPENPEGPWNDARRRLGPQGIHA